MLSIERAYCLSRVIAEKQKKEDLDQTIIDTYQRKLFEVQQQHIRFVALLEDIYPEYYATKYQKPGDQLARTPGQTDPPRYAPDSLYGR